jgi:inosine-uridine nucleoside N-ribohydrolase
MKTLESTGTKRPGNFITAKPAPGKPMICPPLKSKATLWSVCLITLLMLVPAFRVTTGRAADSPSAKRIPVILDTDIGDDIDDTWALALLLNSPELDLKLAVGDYGKQEYRAQLLAKYLERAGRSDVDVGLGLDLAPHGTGRQAEWVKDYALKSYPGQIRSDGVQAIIDTIMRSPQPVTLICIEPVPNIAAALKREPRIALHARFVGMDGSVHRGYGAGSQPCAEWNVRGSPAALQAVFAAPWDITITPLDTCGLVSLGGEKYQRVCHATGRTVADLIPNYRLWLAADPSTSVRVAGTHSSTLFDTVAVYLAIQQDFCVMEDLNLRVTDEGFTVLDPAARTVHVAIRWKDLGAYEDFLVNRLAGAGLN